MNTARNNSRQSTSQRLEYYRLRAHRKARAHYLATKHHERSNILLGVPGIIANTVVGTAIFATLSQQPILSLQILAGLLSLTAGVLAALQTFFKHSERAEKHRLAAANYASIFRKLDLLRLRKNQKAEAKNQRVLLNELQSVIAQIDQLERDSPDVSDRFYDQAVQEQTHDKEGV